MIEILIWMLTMLMPQPLPMTTVAKGEMSAIDEARDVVVRDAAGWKKLWVQHDWNNPAPAVDFSKHTVVGVFLGTRQTAGFLVEITRVSRDGDALIVRYAERKPAARDVTAQVLTMPFHLVSVPAHKGAVRFARADGNRD